MRSWRGKRRPLIGIAGPESGGGPMMMMIALGLWLAGARTKRLTPKKAEGRLGEVDGLVISGGADLDPELYGMQRQVREALVPTRQRWRWRGILDWLLAKTLYPLINYEPTRNSLDLDRDHNEWLLVEEAVRRNIPVLGICRGAQLINVFFGGTLHPSLQALIGDQKVERSLRPNKTIRFESRSQVAEAIGAPQCRINSLHDQAVSVLGRSVQSTARDHQGLIQAIEARPGDLKAPIWGVQWHPEFLIYKRDHRQLFRGFVAKVAINLKS